MASKRPMQNLIMEILQAQPSLRDSKAYLNSFGPRQLKNGEGSSSGRHGPARLEAKPRRLGANDRIKTRQQQMHQFPQHSSASAPLPPYLTREFQSPLPPLDPSHCGRQDQDAHLAGASNVDPATFIARAKRRDLEQSLPADVLDVVHPESQAQPSSASEESPEEADSHNFAQPDLAVRNAPDSALTRAGLVTPVTPETQANLAASLSSPPIQQHTALVKVQGPFTHRQLESIADGMVYLKRLGLVSVIVLDSEDPAWRGAVSDFDSNTGVRIDHDADRDDDASLAPWMRRDAATSAAGQAASPSRSNTVGKVQEVLRKHMLSEVTKLAELLTAKGATARPFPHAMMRVDAKAVAETDADFPPQLSAAQKVSHSYTWASMNAEKINRSPLVSDDALSSVRSALAHDMIPVIAPLALYDDPEALGAPRTVCVHADDVLVGLAREMAAEAQDLEASQEDGEMQSDLSAVDMMPLRLMVINREGGIPSHARGGNPHLSINLASEYGHIMNSFIWHDTNPTATSNLQMVRDCLSFMPHTSSGVVVSHRSPKSLIANLITNKAAHSPSLPHRLLAGREDVRHTPTIVRPGLPIKVLQKFDDVEWDKMQALLEGSFRKALDAEAYYKRLRRHLDFVIVMGDYEGAAIVTHEWAPGEDSATAESIAYLDKFAVLPSLQGSGAVDFLWGALRDEVHGLGLLDALNDNGGKDGFGTGRDLVWKSRSNNPVNRWYYERSNGFMRIDTSNPTPNTSTASTDPIDPAWCLFWADAEQRIAAMSGERRLGAEASADDVLEMAHEKRRQPRETIFSPPSWAQRQQRFSIDEEDDSHDAYADRSKRAHAGALSPSLRRLGELRHTEVGSERLLPVVAPDEQGRLERWARCMSTIPSAWAN